MCVCVRVCVLCVCVCVRVCVYACSYVCARARALGGAPLNIEIISTNKTPPVKTDRFASPHVLAAASVAHNPTREIQKRSGQFRGVNTEQAAQLSDPKCTGGELSGEAIASLPSPLCHRLPAYRSEFGNFVQIFSDFGRGKLLNFCTSGFRSFVPDLRCGNESPVPPIE